LRRRHKGDKIGLSPPIDIMATIKARRQANGAIRYTAIVRKRADKKIVHREARTFTHRSAAVTWAKHREVALEDPSALIRVQQGTPTLAALIRWYIDNFESVSKWQRSKQAHLEFLERHALGNFNALTLTSAELIDHVRSRRASALGGRHQRNSSSCATTLPVAISVPGFPCRPSWSSR
jgi:hypothetical protein